jgi:hypothetical protein
VSALVFNLCMAVGLILIFAGAWLQLGLGMALLTAGLLIWLSTVIAVSVAAKATVRRPS